MRLASTMRLLPFVAFLVVLAGCDTATVDVNRDPIPDPVRSPATYLVTFDATWSAATHPADFPGSSAHFSPLVGATHAPDETLWEVGGTASDGIRSMAETGATATLRAEVEGLGGSAATFVEGGFVGVSPGMAAAEVTVTEERPLATVVTMLAPSPDWFVGTNGLDLREGDGWAERVEVDLVAYDAGTDDGPTYTAANAPRTPRALIAASAYAPLAGTTVGTLTFEKK